MDKLFEGTGIIFRGDILFPSFSMNSIMLILDGPIYTDMGSDTYFSELGLYRYLAGRKTQFAQHILYMVMNRLCDYREHISVGSFSLKEELLAANRAARRYDFTGDIILGGLSKLTLT